ncbi:hypothetical protein D9M68_649600 [compost metagenome]
MDRLLWASATSFMMPASAVSSPIFVTLTVSDPLPLIVPATTEVFIVFLTDCDSPVSIDSLTSDSPFTTTPSAGICAPGRTSTRSSSLRSLTATFLVSPSVTSSASSGSNLASSLSAPWAFIIAAISNQCPSNIIVTSVASSHQKSIPSTSFIVTSKL